MKRHHPGFPSVENVLGGVPLADSSHLPYLQDPQQRSCQGHIPSRGFPNGSRAGTPELGHFAWHRTSLMGHLCSGLPINLAETCSEFCFSFLPCPSSPILSQGSDLHHSLEVLPTYVCSLPLYPSSVSNFISASVSLRTWSDMLSHHGLAQASLLGVWGTLPPCHGDSRPPCDHLNHSSSILLYSSISYLFHLITSLEEEISLLISESIVYDQIPGV